MENQQHNPLTQFFRQPAIFMTLPSSGKFWPEGDIELPVTGEVPVYPMTTKDEVVLRTPDALLNGQGVVDVIQSCCPSIRNAWNMPSVDVDAVLIAIRIASFGNTMEVDTVCPKCKEENRHDLDLRILLDGIKCPNFDQKIEIGPLKFKFRPQHYFTVNQANFIQFEEQKIAQALTDTDMDPEVKANQLTASMQRLVDIGLKTVADSTEYIETADGNRVDNPDFIFEFYSNAGSGVVTEVQKYIEQLVKDAGLKPLQLSCSHCEHPYESALTFDYAHFFAKGF